MKQQENLLGSKAAANTDVSDSRRLVFGIGNSGHSPLIATKMDAPSEWAFSDYILPLALVAFALWLLRKLVSTPAPARVVDLSPKPPPVMRPFTRAQLLPFNGAEGKPLYIAAKGRVFDVSSKPSFYGPGAAYHVFTGRDASRAFALHSTDIKDVENFRIDDLNASQLSALDDWVDFVSARYPEIGFLVEENSRPAVVPAAAADAPSSSTAAQ